MAIVATVLLLKFVPPLLVPSDRDVDAARTESARTALVQAFTGAVLLGGVWFAGRTYLLGRKSHDRDRFAEAIGLLKEKNEAVRIGSIEILRILALEQEEYRSPVESVLVSFIRQKAKEQTVPVALDVIAALETLGARPNSRRVVDLSGVKLRGIALQNANLSSCRFDSADLSGAELIDCDLTNASFEESVMSGVKFGKAKLVGTILDDAKLDGADFHETTVRQVSVKGADLSGVTSGTVKQKYEMIGTPAVEMPIT